MTANMLAVRMLEQTAPWTPWDRRVWNSGTILTLQELVEASRWCSQGVLSDTSVNWLRTDVRKELGQDSGLNFADTRRQIEEITKKNIKYSSSERRQLEAITEFAADNYLDGWKNIFTQGSFNLERASRYISSYMLDSGFHPEHLRKIYSDHKNSNNIDLIEVLKNTSELPSENFTGIVLLKSVPEKRLMEQNASWVAPREVSDFMRKIEKDPPRDQAGALRFEVESRDIYSAANLVREKLERLVSRTRFLRTHDRLSYIPTFWIEDGRQISLGPRGSSISAMSLAKSGMLYEGTLAGDVQGKIDDAFELASHLISSPPPVAVSNAWAAIESLLIDPGESDRDAGGRVVVADRAATILTAAWPRAELTRLSYKLVKYTHLDLVVRAKLEKAGDDNISRCKILLKHWDNVKTISDIAPDEAGAIKRVDELRSNPKQVLTRVHRYMTGSLRRLYRHRNLVMHGGELKPIALASTTRTTGPLVGALLDRLAVFAHLRQGNPLDAFSYSAVFIYQAKETKNLELLLTI